MTTKTLSGDATENHSPGGLLRQCHDRMGAAALADALTVVRARRATLTAPAAPGDDGATNLVDQLLATGQLPDDLTAVGLAARRDTERHQIEITVLNRAETDLRSRRRTAFRDEVDTGLAVLRPLLDETITSAREPINQLGDITSAEEALDDGPQAGAAWTRLRDLAQTYRSLRWTQERLVSDATREDRTMPGVPGHDNAYVTRTARELVALAGHVHAPEDHVGDVATLFGAAPTRVNPQGQAPVFPWATGDPRSDLTFIVATGATAVIPDLSELYVVQQRLRELARHDGAA